MSPGRESSSSGTHRWLTFPGYIQMHVMANEQPESLTGLSDKLRQIHRIGHDLYAGEGKRVCSVPHLPPRPDVRSLDHGTARHESEHT